MMVSVVFDASDESVLDMDNLIGLVGYTAFVGYHHDSHSLFLVQFFQQVHYFHARFGVEGTQNTKIRMEVSGGGKKPWRQKGTGHARQGSIRAPQWTHGGVALGPKPRSYNYHINNKVKRLALLSVLSDKAANGNMVVVDKFACDEYKTKTVVAMLNAVGAGKKNLLVNETVDAKFVKSAGNIAGVKTTFAGSVNTYDVLNADKLIISVDAAKKLEEVLG